MEKTFSGVGIGGVVAGILSWSVNHSIGWLILHIFIYMLIYFKGYKLWH